MSPSSRKRVAAGSSVCCSTFSVRIAKINLHRMHPCAIAIATHASFRKNAVACTSFVGVIIGVSVATSSETASKVLGAINAGCFLYLGTLPCAFTFICSAPKTDAISFLSRHHLITVSPQVFDWPSAMSFQQFLRAS